MFADNIITLSMTFGTGFAYVIVSAIASSQRDNEFTWHMGSLIKTQLEQDTEGCSGVGRLGIKSGEGQRVGV